MKSKPASPGRRSIRPEDELLFLCGRMELDSRVQRVRDVLSAGLDWGSLLPAAQRHGMLPLLHHTLQRIDGGLVPAAILRQVRGAAEAAIQRNHHLTEWLVDLVLAFDEAGISVIPFKGPTLALSAYGDLALRPFHDIDILVRAGDVRRSVDLLRSHGFERTTDLAGAQDRAHQEFQYASTFTGLEEGTYVDLHWAFAKRYFSTGLRVDTVWDETVPVQLPQARTRTLAPEILLLVLCWHGAKHGPRPWPRAIWICDVANLIRANPALDWPKVLAHARRAGGRRILALGLTLAHDLFDAPVPEVVLSRIRREPAVQELVVPIRDRLVGQNGRHSGLTDRVRFDLRIRERLQDKMRYGFARLLQPGPRDWAMLRLPRFLAPLYVPLRIVRLATKSLLWLWPFKES